MRKIAVLALAGFAFASADAAAQTIVRGSTPTPQREGLPQVVRGAVHHPESASTAPATPAPGTRAVGGETLWLLDSNDNLTGCWLRGSGYVGRSVIVCTDTASRRY